MCLTYNLANINKNIIMEIIYCLNFSKNVYIFPCHFDVPFNARSDITVKYISLEVLTTKKQAYENFLQDLPSA